MKTVKNNSSAARLALRLFGLLFSVLPPAVCTLLYFPAWREEGGTVALSGISALLLALSAIPLYRWLGERLRSPSAYTVWLILFIVFFMLSRVADEMTVISLAKSTTGKVCMRAAIGTASSVRIFIMSSVIVRPIIPEYSVCIPIP